MATSIKSKVQSTPLSKELKKIRIDHDITRPYMAKELGISDRELANIEAGKMDVTDHFLSEIAVKYSADRDASDGVLQTLKLAYVNSISTVTFNLTGMSDQQRLRVISLRAALAEENAVALAAAELDKKKEAERKKVERAGKKSTAKLNRPTQSPPVDTDEHMPFDTSVGDLKELSAPAPTTRDAAVDDLDDLEWLSDEELDILAAA